MPSTNIVRSGIAGSRGGRKNKMSLNLVLLTPRRRFIANRFGLGYQIPLGLVFLGGPLVDAGHQVRLIDNDVLGWDDQDLIKELAQNPPDCILIGHTASTAAHPAAMQTAQALKGAFEKALLVYGGVFPSYAAQRVLVENLAIDVIVQGEGEETVLDLADTIKAGNSLATVRGITWRDHGAIRINPVRPAIEHLDRYRPGWELVDWSAYHLFGFGRAAGMQFSRGCTLKCTYCGQWSFWRRWRHRSPENVAGELEILVRDYGVRIVWFADENFSANAEKAHQTLEAIAAKNLNLSLNLNMTAADVVRDADRLALYKQAGVDNIVMGVESLDDPTVERVGKNNPFEISQQAVRLLRQHGIVSLVNIIYGLEDETPATLRRTYRKVLELDADILNAVYITPHFWTPLGRQTRPNQIIQPDQTYYTYRNQVVDTPQISPTKLFLAVKLTESFFHLRVQALWRMFTFPDARYRRIMRAYLASGFRVVLAEVWEFFFQTRRVPVGSLNKVPGFPLSTSFETVQKVFIE